jgi:hypothetical protein
MRPARRPRHGVRRRAGRQAGNAILVNRDLGSGDGIAEAGSDSRISVTPYFADAVIKPPDFIDALTKPAGYARRFGPFADRGHDTR